VTVKNTYCGDTREIR